MEGRRTVTEHLRIDLDRSSPVPLYHQISVAIEEHIRSGELGPGQFLENEIALAARLGISRPTARQALQDLVDKGRLVRKRGVGTQVAPARIHRSVELTSLQTDLQRSGREPSTQVLAHETVPASAEVAEALEIDPGTAVVRIQRLRLAQGEPLAILTNHIPARTAPSSEELASGGLYDALRTRGVVPKVARQRIGARVADDGEATLLDEQAGAAVLTMERTAYDEAGNVIEYGSHIYRASRYAFDTTTFAN